MINPSISVLNTANVSSIAKQKAMRGYISHLRKAGLLDKYLELFINTIFMSPFVVTI